MKYAVATTLFLATLALANPEPAAQPYADAALVDHHSEITARSAKTPRKIKGGKTNSGNTTTDSAAIAVTPSLVLQISALGLGITEVMMLWT